jgi:putative ABC transport system substrate-binding protein
LSGRLGAVLISGTLRGTIQIIAFAAHHALAAMYPYREMVEAGGLISYGGSGIDAIRLAGTYVGRILKGENPAAI